MSSLNRLMNKFDNMDLRERLLALLGAAIILYFIADTALLKPQQKKIINLQQLTKNNQAGLISTNEVMTMLEKDALHTSEQQAGNRATIEELKKQISEAETFYSQTDPSTSQVGALLRELLADTPNLTLVSIKTLPGTMFFSPENMTGGSGQKAALSANANNEVQKTIYRYGVEVSIRGNYMALLSYMENLSKYPKRLFWSEAKLDVTGSVNADMDAVLRLVIYTLSDQANSPLH